MLKTIFLSIILPNVLLFFGVKVLPDLIIKIMFGKYPNKDPYIHHVCDKRLDGMCVDCQINAARALLIP